LNFTGAGSPFETAPMACFGSAALASNGCLNSSFSYVLQVTNSGNFVGYSRLKK
jgi:hypothetical protein